MIRPARLGVIDLGTNTFHLLLVEVDKRDWKFLYRNRIFVNLAEIGIDRISDAAMDRGLDALHEFNRAIQDYSIDQVRAVGTAALRHAQNAGVFLARVREQTGLDVQVISGDQEAAWVARGVMSAVVHDQVPLLIMDIGGGSVEFILVVNGKIRFAQSYPVGVAVLYEQFHDREPITAQALQAMDDYLGKVLADVLTCIDAYPGCALAGASGTFEVVDTIVSGKLSAAPYSLFRPEEFYPMYRTMIAQDLNARLANPDIPRSRARYIVVAMHLVAFVLTRIGHDRAYISAYAMKEGIVLEMIDGLG